MQTSSAPTLEQLRARFVARVNLLAEMIDDHEFPAAVFHEARLLLETLALSTEEVAIARNRLENARNYLETNERGAACYELRLLCHSLT